MKKLLLYVSLLMWGYDYNQLCFDGGVPFLLLLHLFCCKCFACVVGVCVVASVVDVVCLLLWLIGAML